MERKNDNLVVFSPSTPEHPGRPGLLFHYIVARYGPQLGRSVVDQAGYRNVSTARKTSYRIVSTLEASSTSIEDQQLLAAKVNGNSLELSYSISDFNSLHLWHLRHMLLVFVYSSLSVVHPS